MADICGLGPNEVDELWVVDFLALAAGIDVRYRQREEFGKQGIWVP